MNELAARIDKHRQAKIGFVERLVMFWSNHFSMSINKASVVRGTIGQLERDVIRKHVLGDFEDMLLGVIKHPAMIAYLDNEDSVGPLSEYGAPRGIGFNENLAREVLELHTVGSGGGYTEKDVANFARILTGWSYVRNWEADNNYNGGNKKNRGKFIYRPTWHEPGSIKLMGKRYRPQGMKMAVKVLQRMARHPNTAEHIAFKLVRHFITDEPTPDMVKPLKKKFLKSNGNLKQVSLELLKLNEAFNAPLTKLRTPYELSIAQFRALGQRYADEEFWSFYSPLNAMNNMVWEHPTPDGFSDETLHWLDPDGMTLRLDTAYYAGRIYDDRITKTVPNIAKQLFGNYLSRDTRERVQAANSVSTGLAMLFCSPEFQRR